MPQLWPAFHIVFLCMPLQEKPYRSEKYSKMWYKHSTSVGISRKFCDKKQIWSFGSKSAMDQDAKMQLGVECMKKLDGGMSEEDVFEWVLAKFGE